MVATQNNSTIFICVPTYREASFVQKFLSSLTLTREKIVVVIVNSYPQDETSTLINDFRNVPSTFDIVEIAGDKSEFWGGAVQRALDYVSEVAQDSDFICLMNIDANITSDVFAQLKETWGAGKYAFVAAVLHSGGSIISSGTSVRSWFWTINSHPLMHARLDSLPASRLIEIDYAPARCVLFSLANYRLAGPINSKCLPHYGADSEFTLRLAKLTGLRGVLLTSATVEVNIENTGMSVYSHRQNVLISIKQLFHIKNPSNPIYRSRFILLSYPKYAIASALLLYGVRSVLECLGLSRLVRDKFPRLKISH